MFSFEFAVVLCLGFIIVSLIMIFAKLVQVVIELEKGNRVK